MYSSGAEVLASRLPTSRVVSAFGTVPSEGLFDVYDAGNKHPRPSLVYFGDDASAKPVAATLIRGLGFEPLDAGPLRIARFMEPFELLLGQLSDEGERGAEMAFRFEWGPTRQPESRAPG